MNESRAVAARHGVPVVLLSSRRFKAVAFHLAGSAILAGLAALLVFGVWYPPPYAALSGGGSLFTLMLSVDVVLGPMLTAVVAGPRKPWQELRRDIALIALLQCLALGYGLFTLAQARPVYTVFEVDRFRVLSAPEIDVDDLRNAAARFQQLPWTGPKVIGARRTTDPQDMLNSIELGLKGVDIAQRPSRWGDYADFQRDVLLKARSTGPLEAKYPEATAAIQAAARSAGLDASQVRFLPLTGRKGAAVLLLSAVNGQILGHVSVDPFL